MLAGRIEITGMLSHVCVLKPVFEVDANLVVAPVHVAFELVCETSMVVGFEIFSQITTLDRFLAYQIL